MNSYFSRLAQRSGLASTAANVRHGSSSGNAAPDWSEQSVETATPLNTLTSNGESGTPAGAIDNKSIHGSEHSPPSASSQVTNTRSKSMITQQHEQKFDAVNATLNSSLLSNTLGTSSNFIEPDSSQDSLNAETSVTLSTPNERGSKRESFSASAKHASVTFDHPLAIESSSKESFAEYEALGNRVNKAPTEASEHRPVKVSSVKSTPLEVELEIESTGKSDVHTPAVTPANAVQSRPTDVRVEQIKSIASTPVQTPAVSLQTPRAAPRSLIEVHIGKIELEIFSPVTKPAAAPAPVQLAAPRVSPTAAFNPHRHYLRGR